MGTAVVSGWKSGLGRGEGFQGGRLSPPRPLILLVPGLGRGPAHSSRC